MSDHGSDPERPAGPDPERGQDAEPAPGEASGPAEGPSPAHAPGTDAGSDEEAGTDAADDAAPDAGSAPGDASGPEDASGSDDATGPDDASGPDDGTGPEAAPQYGRGASGEAEPTIRLPTSGTGPGYGGGASGEAEPTLGLPTALDTREVGTSGRPEPQSGAIRYAPAAGEPGALHARRFWSGRRFPAALTAAVCTGLVGLFLYDIAAVRTDRKAMAWRKTLANELATRHLDDVWIIVGAAVAAALGLWLIVLAATPGERGLLPMALRGPRGVRAGLDRHAAELVLRDRAMEVPGVRWSRVKVGRRKVKAHAASHFRELDDVRRDLTAALESAVRQLGLAKAPGLRVRVQRAEKKA